MSKKKLPGSSEMRDERESQKELEQPATTELKEKEQAKDPKDSKDRKGFSLLGWLKGDNVSSSVNNNPTTVQQTGTNLSSWGGAPSSMQPAEKLTVEPIPVEPIPFERRIPKLKPVKHYSLAVILIENTTPMIEYVEQFKAIVNKLFKESDMLCIINYGAEVHVRMYEYMERPDTSNIFFEDDLSDKACLYDAIYQMYQEVDKLYHKIHELKEYNWMIDSVKVVGVGMCTENASKTSEEKAGGYFQRIISNYDANTKYLCITDESFINAAKIGFRSIFSIVKAF